MKVALFDPNMIGIRAPIGRVLWKEDSIRGLSNATLFLFSVSFDLLNVVSVPWCPRVLDIDPLLSQTFKLL